MALRYQGIRVGIRTGLLAAAASVLLGAGARPGESARIVGVQTSAHAEFDRVVLQLDRPTEVTRPPVQPGELEVIVAAIPAQEHQVVGREGTRLGRVAIRRDSRGTRVSLVLGERVIRVFTLPRPPRVVIDLGVAGLSPFVAPWAGTPVHPTPGPPQPEPAVTPTPAPQPFPQPVAVEPALPPQPEPAPAVPPEPEPFAEPQPAVQPEPAVEPEPATTPGPEPPLAPAPEPPPRPVAESAPEPPPALLVVSPRAEVEGGLPMLWIALTGVLLVVGLVLGLWLRQRVRRLAGVPRMGTASLGGSPESISPEEIALSGDRVELLEKRLDEEVRARMQLEERLAHVSEEQKVLRDRLQRAARRRDDPS